MLQFVFGFAAIVWASVTDLRTREVPDWLNFSLIAIGVGIALLESAWHAHWWFLAESVVGALAAFAIGAAMYYTGQWGGGDAKLITGMGALFGLPLLAAGWDRAPFLVLFLLCTVLIGAVYGMLWMVYLFTKHFGAVRGRVVERLRTPQMVRFRWAIRLVALLLLLTAFILPSPASFLVVLFGAIGFLTFYLSVAVKAVEDVCFVRSVRPSELRPGDWVVGEVRSGDKVLVPKNNPSLTPEQISLIKRSRLKSVTVKDGIPFVPSFFFAFIAAFFWWRFELPMVFWL
jgi:Flp pilus assembly protein protease CpaA